MKTGIIINPSSGGNKMRRIWKSKSKAVTEAFGVEKVAITEQSKDATNLAHDFANSGFERILVGGGDGTIHEVVNGLFNEKNELINPNIKIGILSGGTGCDYIRSLGIPNTVEGGMDIVKAGKIKRVDVGRVKIENSDGERVVHYMNSSSIGLGGNTCEKIFKSSTILPQNLIYLKAGITEFFKFKPQSVKVALSGKPIFEGLIQNVFVCNGQYSGGGMHWAPGARLDDGELDLLIVKPVGKFKGLSSMPKIFNGTFGELKEVETYRSSQVEIQTKVVSPLELDGEVYACSKASYTGLPQALQIYAP